MMLSKGEEMSKMIDYKILVETKENSLCYRKGKFWIENREGIRKKIEHTKKISANFRILERMLRIEPRVGFALNDIMYFSQQGVIYAIDAEICETVPICCFRNGMNNPLTYCKVAQNGKESIFFGDYWQNPKREVVKIWEFNGVDLYERCVLDGIMHIHNVIYDEYRESFWILTGDLDYESKILLANKSFTEIKTVFSGSQKYRACVLIPNKDGFVYATDTPMQENYLYYSKEDETGFDEPCILRTLPGPCIYGGKFKEKEFFATSVEPKTETNIIKYVMDRHHGPGNIDDYSYLIAGNRNKGYSILFKAKKDIHNYALFGLGNYQIFPSERGILYAYCYALSKVDGKSIVIDLH